MTTKELILKHYKPGMTVTKVASSLGIGRTTAYYHLKRLFPEDFGSNKSDQIVLNEMNKALFSPTGVTQKELAKHLGISPQYLCDILLKRRPITERIANKLGYKKVCKWVKESVT